MSSDAFSITSTLRSRVSRTPKTRLLAAVKKDILGSSYELSLVFVGTRRMHTLNHTYRDKDYATNVLAFPITATSGEIYMCPEISNKEASRFDHSLTEHMLYLFIHACLHLKGYAHGKAMEHEEKRLLKKYTNES